MFRSAQILLVVAHTFRGVEHTLDLLRLAICQEDVSLTGDDLVDSLLLQNEVLNSLLVVDEVEVLSKELIVALSSSFRPLTAAATRLLKAADKLASLRSW